jgi:hypothetical protein
MPESKNYELFFLKDGRGSMGIEGVKSPLTGELIVFSD